MNVDELPVVVIGAGPAGLAAAAQAVDRGLPVVVLEAGPSAGTSVREWQHVRRVILMASRRRGTFVYYTAADDHVRRLLDEALFPNGSSVDDTTDNTTSRSTLA